VNPYKKVLNKRLSGAGKEKEALGESSEMKNLSAIGGKMVLEGFSSSEN